MVYKTGHCGTLFSEFSGNMQSLFDTNDVIALKLQILGQFGANFQDVEKLHCIFLYHGCTLAGNIIQCTYIIWRSVYSIRS